MRINIKNKNMVKKIIHLIAVVFVAALLLFTFTGCTALATAIKSFIDDVRVSEKTETIETSKMVSVKEKKQSDLEILAEFDSAVSSVAEKIKPSVVNIKVKVMQEDFFGNTRTGEGVGSGVIYSSNGYIITNNHVVGNASDLVVTLNDGREYPAKIIASDANTDIAVIKIEAKDLIPAEFVSVDDVKVGELAIAVGSPFGLQQTVTQGVVSAIGRGLSFSAEALPLVDLIQTDASINPGNSGGALVNSAGQVMGINTIIYSTSGSSAGIGFAIPSDIAVNIANQIIKTGTVQIAFMGIEMGKNNTNIKGVLINSTVPGYPAEKAGIKAGDIITEFDGKAIETTFNLLAQIIRHNAGDTVKVRVYRKSSYIDFDVTLAASPQKAS